MQKTRDYKLTSQLLESYQNAALGNALQLLNEARLLLSNGHLSRAYFLALASIEEVGKAYIAFDARGRNLDDGGLCTKIKKRLEDHPTKTTSAFAAWLSVLDFQSEDIKAFIDLMIHLKLGREKSLYVDVKPDGATLSAPHEVVRPNAANDCVRLAANCFQHTRSYLQNNEPTKRSSHQDKLLCIKGKDLTEILNTKDFWWHYIGQLEQGNGSFDKAVVTYHDGRSRRKKVPLNS